MTTDIGELKARLTMEAQNFSQGMQRTRTELLNTTSSTKATNTAMQGLQTTTSRMRQAAEEGIIPTSELASELASQMGGVRDTSAESVAAVAELGGAVAELGPAAEAGAGNAAASIEEMLQSIQTASLAIGGAILAGVGISVKTAADFEAQMTRVKAISGATDGEFQNLIDSALELGASTSKSASEVAIAFEDMAAKGFNATQIIEAMPGVIAAAEASGSDLALTAEVVASALNGFGLEATEASRVADILATTANISAASVDDMGYAFKYVGPVANSLGLSIEEVSAAIGIMTNSGLDGSSAGTALRAALLALNNPAKEQEKIMKELGFSLKDSTGNAKSLSQMFGDLTEATKGMTQAEKVATVAKLVGTEASSGMLAVMAGGVDQLNEFTTSLETSTGASIEAAVIMKDNLKGAVDELTGGFETIGIKVGNEFLPLLTDITRKGAEVVGAISEMDVSAVKTGVAFAGTASGLALVISTVGRLVIAAKALMVTMGPAGWLITGISLLGGVIAAAVVNNRELNESMLANIETQFKEVESLDANIKRFDELQHKSKLTTEQFGRFVDINSELSKTADPDLIAKLKDEQAKLAKESGVSNDELLEMVGLNNNLIETVPEATKKITDQGNAILDNTNYLKDYNNEQLKGLFDQLSLEKIKTETQYKDLLKEEKALINEMQTGEKNLNELKAKRDEWQQKVIDAEKLLNEMYADRSKYTQEDINQQNISLNLSKGELATAQEDLETQAESILKSQEDLEKTREKLKGLEEIRIKMSQIVLAQAGITSEAGKELETINTEIAKLEEKKKKLAETTPVAQKNKAEYQESVRLINEQIGKLETARTRVEEITNAAGTMNDALGKSVYKDIIIRQVAGESLKRMPDLDYHTGGIVGRRQMPMLHTGGLASQFDKHPSHNEIDVRLLRNEMVLTEAQQANLMRMIDAGIPQSNNHKSSDSEINRLLEEIKQEIKNGQNAIIIMDDREVGRIVEPHVTEAQIFKGGRF
jgi:TP901 family phage tail tape measure protein